MRNYKIREFDNAITVIEENGVRMFLLTGDESSLLVDAGYGSGNIKQIAQNISKKKIELIISHPDTDHIGGIEYFNEVYMHPSDFAQFREKCPNKNIKLKPVYENDVFDLGEREWEIIEIPGHTAGSIALLDRKNKILISGDSVQQGPVYMFGTFRSLEAHILSLKKLYDMKDAFDTILACHNTLPVSPDIIPDLTDGAQKLWRGELSGVPVDLGWARTNQYYYNNISYYY